MKVSIIVPVYNVSEYVEECLSSVAAQSWDGEIECIVVDDCGTDDSMEKVKDFVRAYGGKVDFKILHHERNRGLSAARNTGMAEATGDYIFFLDSDDIISSDCLKLLTAPLVEMQYDEIVGDYVEFCDEENSDRKILSNNHLQSFEKDVFTGREVGLIHSTGQSIVMAWNKLFRKDLLKDNGLFFEEGIIHEDYLWHFEVTCVVQSMRIVRECTYHYRKREDSIMGVYDKNFECKSLPSYGYIINKAFKIASERNLSGVYWVNKSIQAMIGWVGSYAYSVSCYLLKKFYFLVRQIQFSKIKMLKADGLNFKEIVRDIHWLFPQRIGLFLFKHINIRYKSRRF